MSLVCAVLAGLAASSTAIIVLLWNKQRDYRKQLQRYSGIVNVHAAIDTANAELERAERRTLQTTQDDQKRRQQLENDYKRALAKYEELQHEVSLLEENLNDISFGLYKPHFSFQTSEEYKDALIAVRAKMKTLVQNGGAATSPIEWTVNGSKKEGAKMIRQTTKVMLRAFNGECDAAAAHVTYNNIQKMEERITKAFDAINKLGETMQLCITNVYLRLRLDEIRLINEFESKRYQERQEEQERREKLRDEEKARREIEHAQQEAEAQEAAYQKLLEKAREEASAATGAKLEELTKKVSEFSAKLDEARLKKEKAIARAQLTRSGFVYVISNVGAFGEGIFKVGMTRRMEPMERIMELSGAAVPFPFDLHAMMYSDDAPGLECALHNFLEERRLNLVNTRKEFFHSVKLSEVRGFVEARGLSAQFIEQPEAREYRESIAQRQARDAEKSTAQPLPPRFADSPFASAAANTA